MVLESTVGNPYAVHAALEQVDHRAAEQQEIALVDHVFQFVMPPAQVHDDVEVLALEVRHCLKGLGSLLRELRQKVISATVERS